MKIHQIIYIYTQTRVNIIISSIVSYKLQYYLQNTKRSAILYYHILASWQHFAINNGYNHYISTWMNMYVWLSAGKIIMFKKNSFFVFTLSVTCSAATICNKTRKVNTLTPNSTGGGGDAFSITKANCNTTLARRLISGNCILWRQNIDSRTTEPVYFCLLY